MATDNYLERVFVIGRGQILSDFFNAPGCGATEIETNIDCDTFIPAIGVSKFQPWYSTMLLIVTLSLLTTKKVFWVGLCRSCCGLSVVQPVPRAKVLVCTLASASVS